MDRLDRISLWAIVILIISSSALISHNMGEARPERRNQKRIESPGVTAQDVLQADKVRTIRGLIEGNNLKKAEMLVRELIQQYPYEGEPRMLMGDILVRKQQPVEAALEFKEAVDLNPDYLDKKTPIFQGKKLRIAVREALDDIEKRFKTSREEEKLRRARKIIYYLQRRIAGSCA